MHGPALIPVEVSLGAVRGEEIQDRRGSIASLVVARGGSRGGSGVRGGGGEGVGDRAGVAVEFSEVAALGVF